MSGWHDEVGDWSAEMAVDLHARIDRKLLASGSGPAVAAARTAVELHAPDIGMLAGVSGEPRCSTCLDFYGRSEVYPCRETVAIATVIGVPPVDGPPPVLTDRAVRPVTPGRD